MLLHACTVYGTRSNWIFNSARRKCLFNFTYWTNCEIHGGIIAVMAKESPAARRNKIPIGEALKPFLDADKIPRPGEPTRLLEIASGCGSHAMYLSKLFPHITWQPSDFQDETVNSVKAHLKAEPRPNVESPLKIDVCAPYDHWGLKHDIYQFIFNANMVHISPWKCTESLFANAGVLLDKGGRLFLYGPFKINGHLEPKSNRDFDETLKMSNLDWGIRDLADIEAEASRSNIVLDQVIDLPANNKLVVWRHDA
jgi:hypothetical protein